MKRAKTHYPKIDGSIEDRGGNIRYEVLQVGNGHALVWAQRRYSGIPPTASGGFGWIEPVGSWLSDEYDTARVRATIERRLRSQLPVGRAEQTAA